MKNVLVLANDYRIILNFRAELIRGLVGEGFNVAVALPPDENNALIEQLGCEVIDLKMSRRGTNPLADCKTLFAIIKILHRFKPACVLTFTIKPNVYGGIACSLLRIPYIAALALPLKIRGLPNAFLFSSTSSDCAKLQMFSSKTLIICSLCRIIRCTMALIP